MLHFSSFSAVLRPPHRLLLLSFFLLLWCAGSYGCFRRSPARIAPTRQDRWLAWTDWSSCSATCGAGRIVRHRYCRRGKVCPSPKETEIKACVNYLCSDSGPQWSQWSACSTSCGAGWTTRSQQCQKKPCREFFQEKKRCNTGPCPIDGGLTTWGSWSSCSVTCGVGTETRIRNCTNPPPQFGGADCREPTVLKRSCSLVECHPKVHGNWSSWTAWGSCSRTCGEGVRQRRRRCDQPAPAYGGNPCAGTPEERLPCVERMYCEKPVDGQWSEWHAWTECSVRCSSGTRTRLRFCNNPSPKNGGAKCPGKAFERKQCFDVCAVDGGWSAWKILRACRADSGTCAKGWQHMERKCDNPAPAHGGKQCKGENLKAVPCWDANGCPEGLQAPGDFLTQSFENKTVLVSWRQLPFGLTPTNFKISFKTLSAADANAKTVMVTAELPKADSPTDGQRYARMVDVSGLSGSVMLWVASLHVSDTTKVALSEKHTIVVGEVDGSWSAWESWSACSRTCRSGRQTRIRRCDSPTRTPKGRSCPGKSQEEKKCYHDC